jgi:2,3-dihydroxyphenylpropionate 1,2-dioxygenase
VAASKLDRRVLFVGSGGLSHDPPVPVLQAAPPKVAQALIAGTPPRPEQRARGEQRVLQAGCDYTAGAATIRPINPEWDPLVLDTLASGELTTVDGRANDWFESEAGGSAHEVRTWIAARTNAHGSISFPRALALDPCECP